MADERKTAMEKPRGLSTAWDWIRTSPVGAWFKASFGLVLSVWKLFQKWRETIVGIMAIILGIIAIRDVREFRNAGQQEGQQFRKDVQQIADSASTRYLQGWPKHTEDLSKLVSNAEAGDNMVIKVDSLGYLHFTDPMRFSTYWGSLLDAATNKKIDIRILTLDEASSRVSLEQQFPGNDFADNSPSLGKTLVEYKNVYNKQLAKTAFFKGSPRKKDFFDAVLYVQNKFFRQLIDTDHVTVSTIHEPLVRTTHEDRDSINESMFLWLTYRNKPTLKLKEMVFAYPKFYGAKTGYAFYSHDSQLIEQYLYEFEQRWRTAKTISQGKDDIFPEAVSRIDKPAK